MRMFQRQTCPPQPNWLFLLLLLLFLSAPENKSNAQVARQGKNGVDIDMSDAGLKSAHDSIPISPMDQAMVIRLLQETIKELRLENEALRIANANERKKSDEKLKEIEIRLAAIETKSAGNAGAAFSSPSNLPLRQPRYDSNYNLIYSEVPEHIRERRNRNTTRRQ